MFRVSIAATAASIALVLSSGVAEAAKTPKILMSDGNRVPACVQPDRLMAFVQKRNKKLDERFSEVASFYKKHGESLGVRWDYAFFQMIVETNALSYKTGSGRWGDVRPPQNNFAGIGATGGGVRGESYPDVSTGVLAHLGHIRLYSGDPVAKPAAKRTKLVEEIILPWAQGIGRPVTFTDLTTKWSPGDKGYSDDIESVAKSYRASYCANDGEMDTIATTDEVVASATETEETVAETATTLADTTDGLKNEKTAKAQEEISRLLETTAAEGEVSEAATTAYQSVDSTASTTKTTTASAETTSKKKKAKAVEKVAALVTTPAPSADACKVFTASYGGAKSLLIEAAGDSGVSYTALAVHDGKESAQAQAFINAYAKGGRTIGEYGTVDEALSKAFELCPEG